MRSKECREICLILTMPKRSCCIKQNDVPQKLPKRTMLRLNPNKVELQSLMFNRLNGMRKYKKHCDFIIKIGSESLDVHRNILAAGSDYFDAMLSHDTKENRSGVVEMIDADAECVEICVDYIYGGKIEEVSMDKCEQLMYVANLMQLQKLCDEIDDLLGKSLNPNSFFVTKRIAVFFGALKLQEKCDKFAEKNLALISKMEEFGDLDKSYVKNMLKSKKVFIAEELKLSVLFKWMRQNNEQKGFLGEMLESIRLDRIPVECLHHLLENEPLVKEDLEIYKIFSISALKAMRVGMTPLRDRGEEVGIASFDGVSTFLQCFNPRANTWRQLQKMHDEMVKNFFSAVSLDDHIYVLMENKSVYRLQYSDEAAAWEQMSDMIEWHGSFPPATVVAGHIYVIGDVGGGFSTIAAEKYNPATDQWTTILDIPRPSQFSELLAVGGSIYSFGGNVDSEHVNKVQRFDPSLSSWTDMKPMKKPKSLVAAVELDRKVYVLGGYDNASLRSCDCYDTDMDEWTSLSPMKTARSYFRAFAVDGFIYAVGGCDSSPDSIEKYDVEKDEWEMVLIPSGMKLKILDSVNVKLE